MRLSERYDTILTSSWKKEIGVRQYFIQLVNVHIDIDSRTVVVQPKPLQLLVPLIITPLYLLLTVQRAYSIINKIEGSQPEWCISSMIYSRDTPFW